MKATATVIIPTYGSASFARWAIQSVQRQTVKEIEIYILCDGSPQEMVSVFQDIAKEDSRIQVRQFPKSPRNGEPYRDIVIRETTGQIICYCAHDDLWLPFHIEAVEKTLQTSPFTHSIHTFINMPAKINAGNLLLRGVHWMDIQHPTIVKNMFAGINYFGLTFGAHRRDSYLALKEGWTTTPPNIATDLYMWRKFLTAFEGQCRTTQKVTALNFQKEHRKDWTEQAREDELKDYAQKIQDPAFIRKVEKSSRLFPPILGGPFQNLKFRLNMNLRKLAQNCLLHRA